MTARLEIYRCLVCGNIVEVLHTGKGHPVCCGQPMQLQEENTVDAAQEKHVPVLEKTARGIKVKVGSVPHPMTEEHYIEWVEVVNGPYVNRKELKPGQAPEAEFYVSEQPGLVVREYCNLHGLWKA